MKKISVSIPGGNGRMGKALIKLIYKQEIFNLCNSTCLPNQAEVGIDLGILVGNNPINKFLSDDLLSLYQSTDVIIDFTSPEASMVHAKGAFEKNIAIVIGTTGFSKKQENILKEYSKKIPIICSANFSIGITMLSSLVSETTKKLGLDWDIEILEMHHKYKVDAPSGTALMLAESAANARNINLTDVKASARNGIVGKRKDGEIGFAVLRGGDVVGEHSVIFSNDGERIELVHKATDRSIFALGAIRAAKWASFAKPGFYSLSDVLNSGG